MMRLALVALPATLIVAVAFVLCSCSPAQVAAWQSATPACVQCAADIFAATQASSAKAGARTCPAIADAGAD